MSFIDMANRFIKNHEGISLKPYIDTMDKMTIGYGRNLDDVGISLQEAEFLLEIDIHRSINEIKLVIPDFEGLSEVRKAVLIDMIFNLGMTKIKKFVKMIQAIEDKDWGQASFEMLDSDWAVQVGERANFLSRKMKEGI